MQGFEYMSVQHISTHVLARIWVAFLCVPRFYEAPADAPLTFCSWPVRLVSQKVRRLHS
jgi:hypothetical protein